VTAERCVGIGRTHYESTCGSFIFQERSTYFFSDEMNKGRNRTRRPTNEPSPKDTARDELFQHIIRCEVVGCDPEHQREWFDETMRYFTERYHELSAVEIAELRTLGERFAQPPRSAASALVNEKIVATA
jgi:hypothetical protein